MSNVVKETAKNNAWPKGIFAITIFTENLEKAKEYYQNVFGLPIEFEDPSSAVFKFGDTLINVSVQGGVMGLEKVLIYPN